ncbi:hypothetical protein NBRC116495_38820 [Aurantivibrio plasticivorans]
MYCPIGFREGNDCYAPGWESDPYWLFMAIGAFMACFSIIFTAVCQPKKRKQANATMLVVGLLLAIPCALFVSSVWAYLATALSGTLSAWGVQRLTRSGT